MHGLLYLTLFLDFVVGFGLILTQFIPQKHRFCLFLPFFAFFRCFLGFMYVIPPKTYICSKTQKIYSEADEIWHGVKQ